MKELNGGIKRALLEVIASGVVTGLRDVERYAACTFFASSSRESDSDGNKCAITETIKFLVDNEFIRVQVNKDGKDKGEDCVSFTILYAEPALLPSCNLQPRVFTAKCQRSADTYLLRIV